MALGTFTLLCNHFLYLVSNYSHPSKVHMAIPYLESKAYSILVFVYPKYNTTPGTE